jgi:hypothetical protein
MPTPTSSFLDVAALYGNVDPNDSEAVQRWFMEVLPTLPQETIEEILEALLASEATSDGKETPRSYPRGVPVPSLSSSPPAPIPILAKRWREIFIKLRRSRK